MVMTIGDRVTLASRRQFAGQVSELPAELIHHLRLAFVVDEDDEFDAGVLSGLAVAVALIEADRPKVVSQILAVWSDRLERREAAG